MFLTFCARKSSRRQLTSRHVLSDSKKTDFCFSNKRAKKVRWHRADWWMVNRFDAHFIKPIRQKASFQPWYGLHLRSNTWTVFPRLLSRQSLRVICCVDSLALSRSGCAAVPHRQNLRNDAANDERLGISMSKKSCPSRNWEQLKCEYYVGLKLASRIFQHPVICACTLSFQVFDSRSKFFFSKKESWTLRHSSSAIKQNSS